MKVSIEKLHNNFGKIGVLIVKYRWFSLIAFALILFICMSGMPKVKTNSSVENWLLEDDPLKVANDKFKEIFGNDQYAGVLLECDDIFKPKNLELIKEMSNELLDSVPFANKIYSLTENEFVEGTEWGMRISKAIPEILYDNKDSINTLRDKVLANENFAKNIVTKDSKQTFIAVKFGHFPKDWKETYTKDPSMMAGEGVMKVIRQEKYASLNPKATGMPVINNEVTIAMGTETSKITMLSLLAALIIAALVLRSFKGVILPFIIAISSIIAMIGTFGLFQYEFNPTFIAMPSLLGIAVSICYSIHILSMHKHRFLLTGKRKESVIYTMEETSWPILFTVLTTIVALLTFLFVPIEFVWFVGVSASLVVFYSYVFTMLLIPPVLSFGKNREPNLNYIQKKGSFMEHKMEQLANWVLKKEILIFSVFAILMIILALGIRKVDVTTDWDKSYGRKMEAMNMAISVAESELGSLYSYDLIVEFPEADMAKKPENLKKLEQLVSVADSFSLTKRTHSILNIIKNMNMALNSDNREFYSIPEEQSMVAQLLNLYETSGGSEEEYWLDYDYKFYRVMIEIKYINSKIALNEINILSEKAKELFPEAKASVVGNLPQSLLMEHYLIRSQLKTLIFSLLLISLLLMIVFRSVKVGLIGLIPNIVPAIVIGGLMGYLKMPLDMITVTLIPMILGLAVDDTIHFINHGKIEFIRTKNYKRAIIRTFRSVGVAILSTSLILSADFLTNTLSSVKMLFNMGVLAVAGIMFALLADVLLMPLLMKKFKIFGEEEAIKEESIEEVPEAVMESVM